MIFWVLLGSSALVGGLGLLAGRRLLAWGNGVRTNWRGARTVTGAGVVIVPAMMLSWVAGAALEPLRFRVEGRYAVALAMLMGVATLLGLLDDLLGNSSDRGFRGHFRALAQGRITTGLVKAIGGLAASLVVAGLFVTSVLGILVAALVMASFMNLENLFDVRPGRALKVWLVATAVMFAFSRTASIWPLAGSWLGPAAVLLAADLREYVMLGDAGSNALGAVIGFLFVVNFDLKVWLVALPMLLVLQLASEKWSFTEAIEAFTPLRWVDELGRPTKQQP